MPATFGKHDAYDIDTAVTFFMAGLGIGTLVALVLAPRREERHFEQRNRRVEATERVAPAEDGRKSA